MVGDTTWDIEAAGRANVPTIIAVLTGGFGEAELREAGAVCVFESIGELRERPENAARGLIGERFAGERACGPGERFAGESPGRRPFSNRRPFWP